MKKYKKQKFTEYHEVSSKNGIKGKTLNNPIIDFTQTENKFQQYETSLQALHRLFPTISQELIENIFEESSRTYMTTKLILEEMTREEITEKNEEKYLEQTNFFGIEESNIDQKNIPSKSKIETEIDLNIFSRFRFEEDDPFIDDKEDMQTKSKNLFESENNKKYFLNLNNVDSILMAQKKNANEYVSVFETISNEITPKNYSKTVTQNSESYLEEMIVDYFVDVILEFFPKLSRVEILEKICSFDYDIDKLILSLLDEKDSDEDFAKLELTEISNEFKEEVLSNFYFGNLIENTNSDINLVEKTLFDNNLQLKIEKEIKIQNINSKLNVLHSEKDFPFLSDEVKTNVIDSYKVSDEFFLELDIKSIKTKSIREDLQKLVKSYPFTDEFEIKWVYYQFMDYHETYKYFGKKGGKRILFPEKDDEKVFDVEKLAKITQNSRTNSSYKQFSNSNMKPSTDNQVSNMLFQIISENPSKWKIEESSNKINLSDYQSIRKKLLWQAQLAWRQGRHQDAKVIIAKARRYKQEIDVLLRNRKISLFVKSNQENYLVNCINNRENIIDLHGLSYDESKIMINKKIFDVERKRSEGVYDPAQKFILNIITGVGHHSKNHTAVLLPKLSAYLKKMNCKIKIDVIQGVIKVFL